MCNVSDLLIKILLFGLVVVKICSMALQRFHNENVTVLTVHKSKLELD